MMRKNRGSIIFLCVLTAGMVLTGCGKSEAEKAAEYYEEQYGMSTETAQELADAFHGEETEQAEESVETVNEFKLYEPLPDMVNSKLGDGLVQIHDVLIYENSTMTVKEVVDALANGEQAERYCYKAKMDDLIGAKFEGEIGLYYGNAGSKRNMICAFKYYNPTDDYLNLEECVITEVVNKKEYKEGETMHCFNVIHAGGLRLVRTSELTEDSPYYEKIVQQMVSYDNQDAYLLSQGYGPEKLYPCPYTSSGEVRVITKPVQTQMQGEKEYCYFTYDFKVANSGRLLNIEKNVCYGSADEYIAPVIYTEQATSEEWDKIIEEVKGEIATINYMDAASFEYQGKIICLGGNSFNGGIVFMIFKGTDEKYYLATADLSIGMRENLARAWFCGSYVFDSIEEAIADVSISHGDVEIKESSFE